MAGLVHKEERESTERVRLGRVPLGEAVRVEVEFPSVRRSVAGSGGRYPCQGEEGPVSFFPVLGDAPQCGG
jgi:hypothetical protein